MYVDSSYWVGLVDSKDQWHDRARALKDRVPARVSVLDLTIAESVTIIGSRRGGRMARDLFDFFRDSCRIVYLDDNLLASSIDFLVSRDGRLSVADAATVQAMIRDGDDTVLSFDSDFDKISGIVRVH